MPKKRYDTNKMKKSQGIPEKPNRWQKTTAYMLLGLLFLEFIVGIFLLGRYYRPIPLGDEWERKIVCTQHNNGECESIDTEADICWRENIVGIKEPLKLVCTEATEVLKRKWVEI